MRIDLPTNAEQRLAAHAQAAGFEDVSQYVSQHLQAFALQPTPDELPPLDGAELAKSQSLIEEGEADLAAGRVRDIREALDEIGERMGFRQGE